MRLKKDGSKSEESLGVKNSEARSSFRGMFGKATKSEENLNKEEDSGDGGKKRGGLFGRSMRKSSKVEQPDSNLGNESPNARKSLFRKKKDKDKDDESNLAEEKGTKARKSLFKKRKEGVIQMESSENVLTVDATEEDKKKSGLRSPLASLRRASLKRDKSEGSTESIAEKEQSKKGESEEQRQEDIDLEKEKELEKKKELMKQRKLKKQKALEEQEELEKQKELERKEEIERQLELEKQKDLEEQERRREEDKESLESQLALEREIENKQIKEEVQQTIKGVSLILFILYQVLGF